MINILKWFQFGIQFGWSKPFQWPPVNIPTQNRHLFRYSVCCPIIGFDRRHPNLQLCFAFVAFDRLSAHAFLLFCVCFSRGITKKTVANISVHPLPVFILLFDHSAFPQLPPNHHKAMHDFCLPIDQHTHTRFQRLPRTHRPILRDFYQIMARVCFLLLFSGSSSWAVCVCRLVERQVHQKPESCLKVISALFAMNLMAGREDSLSSSFRLLIFFVLDQNDQKTTPFKKNISLLETGNRHT